MYAFVHLTSNDEADRQHALRSVTVLGANESLALDDVTLLLHRDAVEMVRPDAPDREWLVDLVADDLTAVVGETCLDARDIAHEDVPDGVELVDSGVSEVVRLQSAGYHYVKIP
ncbi:DsrE family protein [Haloarcula marina]|uniref:DsrE family protein n=1 Tax=Haloarcula marina TaxID=2961574 RepID=UPI0020B7348C|nr:DsrE family protein [Halomicroarcula marina]